MSSVRAQRRWIAARGRRATGLERSTLAALAVACAVLFAVSFLAGRALSSASPSPQGVLPRIVAVQAGALVPASLTAAPAIRPGVAARPRASVRRAARRPGPNAAQSFAAVAPVASAQPVAQTPAVVTPAAPVAAAPAPAPARAPQPQSSAPASGNGSSGGGGVSFDSSG
jgi:hypothetical protein